MHKKNLTVSYSDLVGSSVVVSGGASGIGAALVRQFAAQGAIVSFIDIAEKTSNILVDDLSSKGQEVYFHKCDVRKTEKYQNTLLNIIQDVGKVDVLINNVANDERHKIESITAGHFDDLIAANLKHYFTAIQTISPVMKTQKKGAIINLGSTGWMNANPEYPVYAACKAAIHGLTRGIARDLGRYNIRVNTLVPGWVMTERQKELYVDDESLKIIASKQCLSDLLMPIDIAQTALFLASDTSRMCTSQNFIVDGGWT